MNAITPIQAKITPEFVPQTEAEFLACLDSWEWRIFSGQLYKIMVKEDGEDGEGFVLPFVPNVNQINFVLSLHYRNLILKARQLGFCLDPSTRVLTADLRWVRIDSLKPGDEVVACDEHVPGGRGAARSMRTATVQASVTMQAEKFKITLDDGREVVCTLNVPVAVTEPCPLLTSPTKLSVEALLDLLNVVSLDHEHGTRRSLDDAADDAEAPDRRRHSRSSGGGLS